MPKNTKTLQPSGVLNAITGNFLRRDVNDCIATGVEILLIDLQKVDFIDSSGLGALVAAMQAVKSSGGQMFICSINEQVEMLFELTKMERILKIVTNEEEFKKNILLAQS